MMPEIKLLFTHTQFRLIFAMRIHAKSDELFYAFSVRPYTGCPRRNGQNFERVFLMLNYTDITQNTYIQS